MKSTLKRWGLACALAKSVCMSFMWGIASTAAVTVRGVYRVVRDAAMVRWGRFTDLLKSPTPVRRAPRHGIGSGQGLRRQPHQARPTACDARLAFVPQHLKLSP